MATLSQGQGSAPDQSSFLTPQAGGAGSASAASSNTTSQGGSGNVNFAQSTASSEAKGESGGGSSSGGGGGGGGGGGSSGGGGYDIGASVAASDQTDTSQQQRLGATFGGVGASDQIGAFSVFGNVFAAGASAQGSGPTGGGPVGDAAPAAGTLGDTSSESWILWASLAASAIGLFFILRRHA